MNNVLHTARLAGLIISITQAVASIERLFTCGDPALMTVLLPIIMHSYLGLIRGLLLLVKRPSMHFRKIGMRTMTGYVHLQELYLKLSDI